jgi:hypothetical protein
MRGEYGVCTSLFDLSPMGLSIALYFRMVKRLALLFLALTVIAVPTLYLCFHGEGVPDEDVDALSFNLLALGNVNTVANTTLPFGLGKLSPNTTSAVITYADVVYSLVFLLFLVRWRARISSLATEIDEEVITVSDYAVMVKGLPADATAEEILAHFNGLYDLSKEDWVFKVRASRPVP